MRRECGTGAGFAAVAAAVVLLAACAAPSRAPVGEQLDESTGTTYTVIHPPLELLATRARGPDADPFAYLAPFETNRMGVRSLYLWISVPGEGLRGPPRVLADGTALELAASTPDLPAIGLSRPPYESPAPWNAQFYYALEPRVLARLADARELALAVSYDTAGVIERYVTSGALGRRLGEFAARTAAD